MLQDEIAAHRRMRACLVGIAHLDPPGVAARIAEMDGVIARLEASLAEQGSSASTARARRIEVVPIGLGSAKLFRAA